MAIGLVAGYGTFAGFAGRYLYPEGDDDEWLFVADAAGVEAGSALAFVSPTGVQVAVTRVQSAAEGAAEQADNFLALSSVCPHLGCRVHWEPQNDRFFCPCHNGVFDPSGAPVSGPPRFGESIVAGVPAASGGRGFVHQNAVGLVALPSVGAAEVSFRPASHCEN